ncbi:hypothetical protein A3A69_00750 [candidate division WWE3 bacterium RIFCSPLOWO2_01_FULL_37_15]|uniref:Metallo-beta-lactamase domain-containing protein n=1 Tax=candidate division WWE3 bacterium RIFCSPLOWO2_01_FULL_37_15 TaxID=1802622 RepID=A0A1F4UVW0_UNCKA|nr:MAG: hypothetical protein A3A69_00750 [candidate division WWE3 bacterium RIFCSPLOWO2_01_FULL_37_15]
MKFSVIRFISLMQKGGIVLDFINVGQGDSIFITTPLGRHILIDGGPNYDSDIFLDDRLPFWSCYIDYVVLTHPDTDHLTGVNRILKRCKAGLLVFPEIPVELVDSGLYEEFINYISAADRTGKTSNKSFDKVIDGVNFHFLFPSEFMELNPKNTNDHSVFLCLDYGDFEALFTGDAGAKVLGSMVPIIKNKCSINESLEILKIPHHGSKYNYDQYLVEAMKPIFAVISVGKNKFGHPDPDVIEKYNKNKAKVFRTDELGNISIEVNKDKSFKLK